MARIRSHNLLRCRPVCASMAALQMLIVNTASADQATLFHDTTHEAARQLGYLGVFALIVFLSLLAALIQRNRRLAATRRALNTALQEYNPVLAALPDLVSLKDLQGNYLMCNSAFASVFARDEADVIGRRDHDLLDWQVARRWRAADRAAIEAGRAIDSREWLALPRSGYTALLLLTRKPLYDNDGRLVGVLSIGRDVTEQHRTEKELRKRESYKRALLDNFPFLVWLKDTDGRFLAANQPLADAAGVDDPLALVNKTDLDIWPREVAEANVKDDRTVMVTRRQRNVEEEIDDRGTRKWFETYKGPVIDDRGQLLGTVGFARDVSERHAIEQALRDSEERFRTFFTNHSAILIFIEPESGTIIDANEAAIRFYGYPREQLVGMSVDRIVTLSRDEALAMRRQVVAGTRTHFEYQHRLASGEVRDVEIYAAAINSGGQDLQLSIVHDVTERKLAEQRLRESEDRLRVAGLNTYDLLYEWHVADGRLVWFSDIGRQLGFAPGEIGDNLDAWLALIHPDDLPMMNDSVERHMRSTDPIDYQYRVRHADGSYRLWQDKALPVLDNAGRPTKWVGVCTDITEQHVAEERQRLAAAVFNHAHEGILVTDQNARIIDTNQAFTDITGYTRDEALGRNPSFLSSGCQDAAFYRGLWQTLTEHGHWNGEIWNRRKDGRTYAEHLSISAIRDARGVVERYVGLFSDITTLKEQQSQLERIAYYDALTDLPNRVMLGDRLLQAMRHAERTETTLAVVYLDLDGFKEINDTHGHDIGDAVLVELASRLAESLRADDTLARLGGDEFVAILGDLSDANDCVGLLPRMLDAAARPLNVGGLQFSVSASLGVAVYPQAEALDPDQLLRQADQAMYQAKLAGKNRYVFFDSEQDQSIRGQTERIEEVRAALNGDAFVLHYQPKVNMRSGEVIGVEALIRWPQADGSLRPPGEFLPLIEHDTLASELDEWVIGQALSQLEAWQAVGMQLSVSVNVSAFHLQQADFIDRLRRLLDAHPAVAPDRLIIEVLETTALMDLARMSEVIRTAQAMGVVFALDDFGTGFSSLDYLKNLPARQLKIDRSFVRNMLDDRDDLAILEGIVGLANAFSRDLIAEGVEDVEHGEILLRLGCDIAQGFGIGRPMPAEQLPAWIAGWQPDPSWRNQTPIARDDLPLMFAMVEHRAWINALQSQLNGKQLPVPEIDETACNFGRWLHGPGNDRYSRKPGFATVHRLHTEIHGLAGELLACERRGDGAAAETRLDEVFRLRDSLIAAMKDLLHQAT